MEHPHLPAQRALVRTRQAPAAADSSTQLSGRSAALIGDAAIVSAASVISTRLIWIYPATYLPRFLSRRIRDAIRIRPGSTRR